MARTEILKPRTWHTNLKGQGLAQLIVFSQLPIEFHSQNYSVVNRNQTSCVISIIPNFLAGFLQKMSMTKIKLFSVTSELWIHIKCNKLTYLDCRQLQNYDESWYCIDCCSTIFSFNSLSSNKNFLACCINTDNNITQWRDLEHDHNSSLSLKPSLNLELLVNRFNNGTPQNSKDPKNISSSNYCGIEEMLNIEIPHKNKSLSLFHINACSLNKNFDDLQHHLSCTKTKFDIIAIIETSVAFGCTNAVQTSRIL